MFRIIGYPELLGRLLSVTHGAEDGGGECSYSSDGSMPFSDPLGGAHGAVLAGLGHDRAELTTLETGESAAKLYEGLGYRCTPRAAELTRASHLGQHLERPRGSVLSVACREALVVPPVGADRRLGDRTVVATLEHLARHHGDDARSVPVAAEDPPWLYDQGRPASLLAQAFAFWGITAAEVGDLEGVLAADILPRLGWEVSPRAISVLACAHLCEHTEHTWGEIAHMAATLHVSLDAATEVDR